MEPGKGNFSCPECPSCRSGLNLGGFQKVLQHDDVGISIYRYKAPEGGYERRVGQPREVFILQTAKNVVELNLDLFAKEFEKCKSYCPRCKEMLRRAETLFKDVPSVHKRGVTGLCGHMPLRDYFYCPPCKQIVDRFLKYTKRPQQDPECTRLQTYLDRSATRVNPPQFEDAVKSAVALQIKETAEMKRKQRAESGDKENIDPTMIGTTPLLSSAGGAGKSSSKTTLTRGRDTESSKTKKKGRDLKGQSVTEAEKSKKQLNKNQRNKNTQTRKTSEEKRYDKSMNVMRLLIAKQLKEKLEIERHKRELEKEKQGIEKQAVEAEKKLAEAAEKAKQAEEARRLRLQSLLEKQAAGDIVSLQHVPSVIDECSHAHDSVHNIIRGEKIIRTAANQVHERDLPDAAPKEQPPTPVVLHPPAPPSSPIDGDIALSFANQQGILRYSLSNREYIEKGWTLLPREMIFRKMTVYRMRPARPEFDWFEMNRHRGQLRYDTGQVLATFDEGARARIYYRGGDIALDYYAAEEEHAGQRLVLYSTGARDRAVLAMFDYAGNGVVFDHTGNVRLKYNQTEGIVLDSKLGPRTHWKWHSLNDSPALRSVMIDTHLPFKDPYILHLGTAEEGSCHAHVDPAESDAYMKTIEIQNAFNNKNKPMKQKFTPYQIRMKAVKINDYFSLRIFEQSAVYLVYCDGKTRFKINMGMDLDPTVIIDQDISELGDVGNSLDKLPARSASVEQIQKVLWRSRTKERLRIARERRVNPPVQWVDETLIDRSRSASPPRRSRPTPCQRFKSVSVHAGGYCPNKP